MVEAILLDSLLILAVLLLIPLGVARGGLREVCSAAGMLLGILVSQLWAVRWGDWVGDLVGADARSSRFIVAVVIVLATTAIVGYGASSAFSYSPGPGGKIFGAAIAVVNGVVLAGFVVNAVAIYINDGGYPEVVEEGQISRTLASGLDWVLLIAAGVVVVLSLMGMVVREREPADEQWMATPVAGKSRMRQVMPTKPYLEEETEAVNAAHAPDTSPGGPPVKVREVRHWENQPKTRRPDTITGWQRTWPKSATGERIRAPWEPNEEPGRPADTFRKVPPAHLPVTDSTETLQQFVADEDESQETKPGRS
ncbi:MAG: CvpA family protein [Thermomicrobiales bacterium]